MSDSHDDRNEGWDRFRQASRPRAEDSSRSRSDDPLAELARLIDEDPFADFDRPLQTEPQADDRWLPRDPAGHELYEEPADPFHAPFRKPEATSFETAEYHEPVDQEDEHRPEHIEPPTQDLADHSRDGSLHEANYEEDPDHARLFADIAEAHARPIEAPVAEPAPRPAPLREGFDPAAALEAQLFEELEYEDPRPAEEAGPAPALESDPVDEVDWLSPPTEVEDDRSYEEPPILHEADLPYEADQPYDDPGYRPASYVHQEPARSRRGVFIIASVVGLVVAGGAAGLGYRGLVADAGGPPPLIRADAEPTKVEAEAPAAADSDAGNKLVYDRVGGVVAEREERLVSREEPVFDVGGNRDVRVIGNDQQAALRGSDGGGATGGERPADLDQPRRVRTVVVRPDGTIVNNSPAAEAAASGAAEPVPAAPAVPSAPAPAVTQAVDATPSGSEQKSSPAELTQVAAADPDASAQSSSGVPMPQPRPGDRVATAAQAPAPAQQSQPTQDQRSSGQPLRIVPGSGATTSTTQGNGQTQLAQAPTSEPQAPASVTAAAFPAGSYVVQVGSTRGEDEARGAASNIEQRYGSTLGEHRVAIERADLGDRGIFHRLAVGPINDQAAASTLCDRLKSAGLDCFVRRN